MKITTREYLLNIKRIEREAIDYLTDKKIMYALKFKENTKTKDLIKNKFVEIFEKSYRYGLAFGNMIVNKIKSIENGLSEKDLNKYKVEDSRMRPARYRLSKKLTYDHMIKEVDIERIRFLSLYDLRVNAYLKDGFTRNKARTNMEIQKLEYDFTNRVRNIIANTVYLFAQIGQIDALKKSL